MQDHEFLSWLHGHLIAKGVNRNTGYMTKLQDIAVKARETLHPLWTPEEVAEYYGIPLKRLKNWRENRSGGPAYVKIGGGITRYRQEDLTTWELTRLRRPRELSDDDGTD